MFFLTDDISERMNEATMKTAVSPYLVQGVLLANQNTKRDQKKDSYWSQTNAATCDRTTD